MKERAGVRIHRWTAAAAIVASLIAPLTASAAAADDLLDPTFGDTGVVNIHAPYDLPRNRILRPADVAMMNGNVLVLSNDFLGENGAYSVGVITKLDTSGERATKFGTNGQRQIETGYFREADTSLTQLTVIDRIFFAVSGVSGYFDFGDPYALVAHLNRVGRINTNWGNDGFIRHPIRGGGTARSASSPVGEYMCVANALGTRIWSHIDSGQLNPSFSADGSRWLPQRTYYPGLHSLSMEACGFLPDGGVVAVLRGEDLQNRPKKVLINLDPTGRLDPDFGAGGVLITDALTGGGIGNTAVVRADGGIYYTGPQPGTGAVAVVSLGPDGAPDEDFGDDGIAAVPQITAPGYREMYVSEDRRTGAVLASGRDTDDLPYVIRLTDHGELDPGFADGGIASGFWRADSGAAAATTDAHGRVLATLTQVSRRDHSIARFAP